MLVKFFTKLFGTKSERDLKGLWPYVEQINHAHAKLKDLSHDALRQESFHLQMYVRGELSPILEEIEALEKAIDQDASIDIGHRERRYMGLEKLKKYETERVQKILAEVLPHAFAIVKETAYRFATHEELVVAATPYDYILSTQTDYVSVQDEQAIWRNQWEAAGNPIVWNMVHYDVQLVGGVILHQGRIAEMATGEGKTLVATLPAFLNALLGRGVHVVTVNEYLAKRDSEWMGPLYQFHGMKVDCINKYPAYSKERQQAYQADIVYGTNNEFGFDYLRDNMVTTTAELVQRDLFFAIIDEVDSVLIDDARTPLIISGPVDSSDEHLYAAFQPRIRQLYEAQKALVAQFLKTAQAEMSAGNKEEGGLALFRAYRGLPKHKPLIKYLSEVGVKQLLRKVEDYYLQDNSSMMPEADEPLLFTIDEKDNSIELTERGINYITQQEDDPEFFVLPDLGLETARIEENPMLDSNGILAQKDALIKDYTVKSQRIHVVNQLLKAYTLFDRDVEYIVVDHRVKIVDEQTGRVLEGRRYSDGLHQAIEAKEGVNIEKASQTYATITLQNYFRMYHKRAGMTGTAVTEAGEFYDIYKIDVVAAPTHQPVIREDKDDKVYKTAREKFNAIIEEITTLHQQGRPVLVGTTSVEISELMSHLLTEHKIQHQVLNAKHHQQEAEIVAEAGKASTVTIATNMAGRGTDIKLTPEAKAAGGLAIIGTERHESRRVDRQLRGRAGRQGDVGSSQFFLSLEDSLMRLFGSDRIIRIMDTMGLEEGEVIQHRMITRSIERAQKKVEQSNFAVRKRLLEYDNIMNMQRATIYKKRRHALWGHRLRHDVMNMLYSLVEYTVKYHGGLRDGAIQRELRKIFGVDLATASEAYMESLKDKWDRIDALYAEGLKIYEARKQYLSMKGLQLVEVVKSRYGASLTDFSVPFFFKDTTLHVNADLEACIASNGTELIQGLEKAAILHFIDLYWKEHLKAMDDLKQAVQNAVYERQDPVLVYNFESFKLFGEFVRKINEGIATFMCNADMRLPAPDEPMQLPQGGRYTYLQAEKQETGSLLHTNATETDADSSPQPRKSQRLAKRNDRVTVRYANGLMKENVKFKTVEEDLAKELCVLVENHGA